MKSFAKFDSLFVNIQCAVVCLLEKVNLKFKLLYLLNHISYFNEICRICCLNTHIQSLKVWLKSVLPWLKYGIFSKALFFIGAPCTYKWPKLLAQTLPELFQNYYQFCHHSHVKCNNNYWRPTTICSILKMAFLLYSVKILKTPTRWMYKWPLCCWSKIATTTKRQVYFKLLQQERANFIAGV